MESTDVPHVSDLWYHDWTSLCHVARKKSLDVDVKKITYILETKVDPIIQATILRASGQRHLPPWPGVKWTTANDAGLRILGTPLGLNVARFYAQHKATLGGQRTVVEITAWAGEDGMVSLLFSMDGADGRLPRTTDGEPASSS